jgi:hypothetical protein
VLCVDVGMCDCKRDDILYDGCEVVWMWVVWMCGCVLCEVVWMWMWVVVVLFFCML